jgi:(R,R)-butanediol dehydrogenase/meso-butanediol dehydrogenase/diacetyl reductase
VSPTAGHEISGVIEALGSDVPESWPDGSSVLHSHVVVHPQLACGECANCRAGYWTGCERTETIRLIGLHRDGGFAEYLTAPLDHLVQVPNTLSLANAALAEPLAVAIHAVNVRGEMDRSEPVAVMGDGSIGLLTARLLMLWGFSDVSLIGRHAGRLSVGSAMGLERRQLIDAASVAYGESYRTVFQTAGTQEALESGLGSLAQGGTVVTIAYLHGDDAGLHASLIYQLIRREHTLRGACGYTLGELQHAVQLLNQATLDVTPLIGAIVSLDNIVKQGFERLVGKEKAPGKILVQPLVS